MLEPHLHFGREFELRAGPSLPSLWRAPIIKEYSSSILGKFPCPNQGVEGGEDYIFFHAVATPSLWQGLLLASRAIPPIIKEGPHKKGKFKLHLWKIPLPKPGGGGGWEDYISFHAGDTPSLWQGLLLASGAIPSIIRWGPHKKGKFQI